MKYSDIVEWSAVEVAKWLVSRGFDSVVDTFLERDIDGDQLLLLTERSLTALVKSGIMRKRLWRDLRLLMRSLDYSASAADLTAEKLADTGVELVEFTHKLVRAGLQLETVTREDLGDLDTRLRLAGVESLAGRYRVREMLEAEARAAGAGGGVVVIGPGDSSSRTFTSLVTIHLQLRGLPVSLDMATANLCATESVVLVLQHGAKLAEEEDLLELVHSAQQQDKRIILVTDEMFDLGAVEGVLDTADLEVEHVRWIHDYQEAAVDKIEKLIRTGPTEKTNTITCSKDFCGSMDSGMDDC